MVRWFFFLMRVKLRKKECSRGFLWNLMCIPMSIVIFAMQLELSVMNRTTLVKCHRYTLLRPQHLSLSFAEVSIYLKCNVFSVLLSKLLFKNWWPCIHDERLPVLYDWRQFFIINISISADLTLVEPTAIKESRNILRVIISKLASLDPLNETEKESLKQIWGFVFGRVYAPCI